MRFPVGGHLCGLEEGEAAIRFIKAKISSIAYRIRLIKLEIRSTMAKFRFYVLLLP